MNYLNLFAKINDSIIDALLTNYYSADDLININYYEIYEWINLDPNKNDKIIDDYITKICRLIHDENYLN